MARKILSCTFIQQLEQQLFSLRDPDQAWTALRVYVAGIAAPWEFDAENEFEFHEDTSVLIVRDGPGTEAEVPEYVFRLDAVVATQLV
jgi:hypothetical protein